ncbi:hypothetical protein [Paraflavitalea speifideaquila]|uniref:hypothetical protein n=1 Tax=Paraflavitalea speifideaquila TaxID=3076558 RepID=UPI0028EE074A|nr:hypothetical protein [Paraflavitalea speifideiaquila]
MKTSHTKKYFILAPLFYLRNTNLTNAFMTNCLVESALFKGALTTGFKFVENYCYGNTLGQKEFELELFKTDSFDGL